MKLRLALLLASLSFAGRAHADMIVNGSFESPVIPAGTQESPVTGTTIPGWTVIGPAGSNVQIFSNTYHETGTINGGSYSVTFNAADGVQSIDLSGIAPNVTVSGVEQTVATVNGQMYELSFYVGRADTPLDKDGGIVDLSINHGLPQIFTNTNDTPGGMNWQQNTVSFVATGSSTTLDFTFAGIAPPDYVAGLDDVTLNPVPVPSTLLMSSLLFGMVGMSWSYKRLRGNRRPNIQ